MASSSRMTALLALLAVAGYQNRDKLGDIFGKITGGGLPGSAPGGGPDAAGSQSGGGLGGLLGGLTGSAPGGSPGAGGLASAGGLGGLLGGLLGGGAGGQVGGGNLGGGLGDLIDNMKRNGQGDAADSWVQRGPNRELGGSQLEQALGSDTLDEIAAKTGLSRDDLLARLQSVLPTAIDKLTPEGRLPTEDETARWRV